MHSMVHEGRHALPEPGLRSDDASWAPRRRFIFRASVPCFLFSGLGILGIRLGIKGVIPICYEQGVSRHLYYPKC